MAIQNNVDRVNFIEYIIWGYAKLIQTQLEMSMIVRDAVKNYLALFDPFFRKIFGDFPLGGEGGPPFSVKEKIR